MGGSSSSLLDESKCTYIRGKTEAVIKNFSPHYKRQYTVSFCKHIQNELEQSRDLRSQFLKTKPPAESSVNFYEGELFHFAEDLKKWKDRYVVIKNNYTVEIFENKEAFQKGVSSKSCILPVGGKVLTTEEDYNLLSDKHFPDPNASNEKESTQAFVVFPKKFPVCLWQPFLRHSYFCFLDPESQKQFSTLLNDCIRHLNHDFFKQASFEAEAFLEAVQFFRQEKGQYGSWEMITGNEVQILSNLVMEELLPNLQTMLLPKMKGKRNDRKRAWFGILEDTYHLVQEQVSEGLNGLKEECKEVTKGLEGTIRSDMDQILTSKNFVAGKINEIVSQPAQKCCGETIQPFLASILEELMGPVSSGFSEVHLLFEKEVNEINQNFQATNDTTKLEEDVNKLMGLPYNSVKMELCYQKVDLLQEQLQDLKSRFKFYSIDLVIQRTQNLMQELMENAVYTFQQLLGLSNQRDVAKMATVIEKVKLRVLKQYDYDSSTVRKKIFQDALVQITLPTLQRTLASTCKPELQQYEQYIFADYTTMIQVENVYEEILLQTLLDEIQKVIKEAAHLKKHNLFEETNLPSMSVSSLSDLKTPSGSAQASPARKPATSVTDTDTQSNEVFAPQKITLEECHETRKMLDNEGGIFAPLCNFPTSGKEQEAISDLGSNQESCTVILKAVEEKMTQHHLDVEETSISGNIRAENEVPVEEKNLPDPDSVNEIRNLLTVTVEIPANVPPESKEVVHACEISRPQDCAGDRDQEDIEQAEECKMPEVPESPKVHIPPIIEAGDTKVTSISFASNVETNNRNVTSTSIPASAGDRTVSRLFPQDSEADYINIPSISSPSTEADYINVSNISSPLSTDADYVNVSSTSFFPSTEAENINVTSISGEEKGITQVNSPEVSEEPGLCQASKVELEAVTSIWYTDVESSNPAHQSQTKQYTESEQSDQREMGLSPFSSAEDKEQVGHQTEGGQFDLKFTLASGYSDPMNEKSQMEQDADNGGSEAVYFPHAIPEFDSSQMVTRGGTGKSDLQEAGLSSLHTVQTELDAQCCSGDSLLETQELISNISNLTIEPADLIVSPEGKENENSSLETPMKVISKCFDLAEQEDSKQAGASLLSADVSSTTEDETGTEEKAEGNCSKSPSEK
ncbi:protein Niban 1 [Tiliqua scincoides]|uniref:protein Niban 1 n=1 Tax=Tiliqua scincoides TaxID=71010 RepID=UPI0034635015